MVVGREILLGIWLASRLLVFFRKSRATLVFGGGTLAMSSSFNFDTNDYGYYGTAWRRGFGRGRGRGRGRGCGQGRGRGGFTTFGRGRGQGASSANKNSKNGAVGVWFTRANNNSFKANQKSKSRSTKVTSQPKKGKTCASSKTSKKTGIIIDEKEDKRTAIAAAEEKEEEEEEEGGGEEECDVEETAVAAAAEDKEDFDSGDDNDEQPSPPIIELPPTPAVFKQKGKKAANTLKEEIISSKRSRIITTATTTSKKKMKKKKRDCLEILQPQFTQRTPRGCNLNKAAAPEILELDSLKRMIGVDNIYKANSCATTQINIIHGVNTPALFISLRDLIFTKSETQLQLLGATTQDIKTMLCSFDLRNSKKLKQLLGNSNYSNEVATIALEKYSEDLRKALCYRTLYTKTATKLCQLGRKFKTDLSIIYNDRLQTLPFSNDNVNTDAETETETETESFFTIAQILLQDVYCLLGNPSGVISNCAKAILMSDKSCNERLKGSVKTPSINQLLKDQTATLSLLKKVGSNITP